MQDIWVSSYKRLRVLNNKIGNPYTVFIWLQVFHPLKWPQICLSVCSSITLVFPFQSNLRNQNPSYKMEHCLR